MPSADSTPDAAGTITRRIPSSSATAAPCMGPGAAEREKREAARVDAAFDRHHADRGGHLGVRHPEDPLGRLADAEAELAGERLDRTFGGVAVEPHVACERHVPGRGGRAAGSRRSPSARCRRVRNTPAPAPRPPTAGRRAARRRRRASRCCRRPRRRCGRPPSAARAHGPRPRARRSRARGPATRRSRRTTCRPCRGRPPPVRPSRAPRPRRRRRRPPGRRGRSTSRASPRRRPGQPRRPRA